MIGKLCLGCFLSLLCLSVNPSYTELHAEYAAFTQTEDTILCGCSRPGCPCNNGQKCRPG